MPCYDSRDHDGSAVDALRARVAFTEAALCATLKAFKKALEDVNYITNEVIYTDPLMEIDFREAGIAKADLKRWWKEHIAKDEKRKAEEAEAKRVKQLKFDALAKLSLEEKKVLGLK